MHASYRAYKTIDCVWRADVGDVIEHPIQDSDLSDAGDDGGDHLDFEEEFGGNFHVVA